MVSSTIQSYIIHFIISPVCIIWYIYVDDNTLALITVHLLWLQYLPCQPLEHPAGQLPLTWSHTTPPKQWPQRKEHWGPNLPSPHPTKYLEDDACVTVLTFKNLREHTIVHKCVRLLSNNCVGLDSRLN